VGHGVAAVLLVGVGAAINVPELLHSLQIIEQHVILLEVLLETLQGSFRSAERAECFR